MDRSWMGNIDRLMPSGLVIACSWFSSRAGRVPPDDTPPGAQEVLPAIVSFVS